MRRPEPRPERWTDETFPAPKREAAVSWWTNLDRQQLEDRARVERTRMSFGKFGAYSRAAGTWD